MRSRAVFANVENREVVPGLMVDHLRRPVRIHDLACRLRLVLPIAKPTLELLRLCYIFNGHVDFCAKLAYNTIIRGCRLQLFGELDPGT